MNIDEQKLDDFINSALTDLAAGYNGVMVNLGHRLGLYKAMAGAGPLTAVEIAKRAGCYERYVHEWLNSQAASGYLLYHPSSQSFELEPEHAMVLADEDSPAFLPTAWDVPASMWFDQDRAIEVFQSGEGVPWGEHNGRLFCGSAAFYRNAYKASLISEWLPSIEGIDAKLQSGIKVGDIGCGHGHSTVLMAETYPKSIFYGYDTHDESLNEAQSNADKSGVSNGVTFTRANAREYEENGFDLICFFDCLHDMGDPLGAVQHAANSLSPDGSVMLIEPRAQDRLEENLNPVSQLFYAASTTICCALAISEGGDYALGAQAGEARLAEIFKKAGFSKFERTLESPFNMIFQAQL